jgi:hypothetical protein
VAIYRSPSAFRRRGFGRWTRTQLIAAAGTAAARGAASSHRPGQTTPNDARQLGLAASTSTSAVPTTPSPAATAPKRQATSRSRRCDIPAKPSETRSSSRTVISSRVEADLVCAASATRRRSADRRREPDLRLFPQPALSRSVGITSEMLVAAPKQDSRWIRSEFREQRCAPPIARGKRSRPRCGSSLSMQGVGAGPAAALLYLAEEAPAARVRSPTLSTASAFRWSGGVLSQAPDAETPPRSCWIPGWQERTREDADRGSGSLLPVRQCASRRDACATRSGVGGACRREARRKAKMFVASCACADRPRSSRSGTRC